MQKFRKSFFTYEKNTNQIKAYRETTFSIFWNRYMTSDVSQISELSISKFSKSIFSVN